MHIKHRLREILFGTETAAGKFFDLAVIVAVVIAVIAVIAESVDAVRQAYPLTLRILEIAITVVFSVEYALRVYCAAHRGRYVFSFFGIVDLIAVLPVFLAFVLPGARLLRIIRIVRTVRILRLLKLTRYLREARLMQTALLQNSRKIAVFIFFVLNLVILFGALMYLVEGEAHGFTSIPKSLYWAIVTLTTVGYGDISPGTPLGQAIATLIMLLGFSIIAVPTGIVIAEVVSDRMTQPSPTGSADADRPSDDGVSCQGCGLPGHDADASFCKHCGARLSVGHTESSGIPTS